MSKKRILVTGGAGFIGSHLCERLIAEGNSVICRDNLFTSQKELNWKPTIPFAEGLTQTVDYFRNLLKSEVGEEVVV